MELVIAGVVIGVVALYVFSAGSLGVASSTNKRMPAGANGADWLWVMVVIVALPIVLPVLLIQKLLGK
jgi:hypothetical protein